MRNPPHFSRIAAPPPPQEDPQLVSQHPYSKFPTDSPLLTCSLHHPFRGLFLALKSLYRNPFSWLLRSSKKKRLRLHRSTHSSCSFQEFFCCSSTPSTLKGIDISEILAPRDDDCYGCPNRLDAPNHAAPSSPTVLMIENCKHSGFFNQDCWSCSVGSKTEMNATEDRGGELIVQGIHLQSSLLNVYPRFTIQELSKATSNFSEGNMLGEGSSGTVYRGKLASGLAVAVKLLSFGVREAELGFITEIEIMSAIQNRHILPLLGYCVEDRHFFLVYKYMKRGSLERWLHGKGKPVLSWRARCKVAIGIAKALQYLHTSCSRPIIHRDVKASNILLSNGNNPKLSDFGLAIRAPDSFVISSEIVGTFGYLAPEYFQWGKVSNKIDVYSFGVVLLELITGKEPIDPDRPSGEENLVHWARHLIYNGCTEQLADPQLKGLYCAKKMQRMLCTAFLCVHPIDTRRPAINQVLHLLEKEQDANVNLLLMDEFVNVSFTSMDSKLSQDEQKRAENIKERERSRFFEMAMADSEDNMSEDSALLGDTVSSEFFS